MNIKLIMNPRSKSGSGSKHANVITAKCRQKGLSVDHVHASSYQRMMWESRKANQEGYDTVVAVGGDGTINAVLNGFYNDKGERISSSKMGVIYTGTSPDFCKSYGIPLDHEAAIDQLCYGKTKELYCGQISMITNIGSPNLKVRYFACCSNIGMGAAVARDSNRYRKYTGDFLGTFGSLMQNVARYKSHNLSLCLDGKYHDFERVLNISVGRTPYIASGIKVKGQELANEEFYVLIANNVSLKVLPKSLRQLYSGQINNSGCLQLHTARNVQLSTTIGAVEVEFDGDPAGYSPCEIKVAKDPIDLCGGD